MGVLSVGIMAHPSREGFVRQLEAQLPGVPVAWDRIGDRWHTGARALLAFDPRAEWHLVVQDDTIPCRDFLPGVERALAACPVDGPVSFYLGNLRPTMALKRLLPVFHEAKRVGAPWVVDEGPRWGPAIAVPTAHILDLVSWGDRRPDIENYDLRIASYYEERRIRCRYSVPSLVDHRSGAENPSLIPERTATNRCAVHFIGDASPLDIDWTRPPVVVPPWVVVANPQSGQSFLVQQDGPDYHRLLRQPEWQAA